MRLQTGSMIDACVAGCLQACILCGLHSIAALVGLLGPWPSHWRTNSVISKPLVKPLLGVWGHWPGIVGEILRLSRTSHWRIKVANASLLAAEGRCPSPVEGDEEVTIGCSGVSVFAVTFCTSCIFGQRTRAGSSKTHFASMARHPPSPSGPSDATELYYQIWDPIWSS